MHYLLNLRKARLIYSLLAILFMLWGCGKPSVKKPFNFAPTIPFEGVKTVSVDTINTINEYKLKLTQQYCQMHYGYEGYRLDSPKMVVVHHTVIPTLAETLALFKRNHLASGRRFIQKFSPLNVGIHYVIDRNGDIYSLMPDTVVARHILGFNHVSLGIENVARDTASLTAAQLESNVWLVALLTQRHPSLKFLIGHDEYNDKALPHYALFKSLNPKYQPYDKPDPGPWFMAKLRQRLKSQYGLEFRR